MSANETQPLLEEIVGTCKTTGRVGPPYQVIGRSKDSPRTLVRIVLLESGDEADYPLEDALADPEAR